MTKKELQTLAKKHGTPLVIVDHDKIRANYAMFRKYLPRVQCYFALRFGEKFEHKLSDTTKIWQTAEYIPAVEDWPEKDLINFEIGISTKIRGNWDLQVKYQVNYDNGVSYGKECTDTRLIAATTYTF